METSGREDAHSGRRASLKFAFHKTRCTTTLVWKMLKPPRASTQTKLEWIRATCFQLCRFHKRFSSKTVFFFLYNWEFLPRSCHRAAGCWRSPQQTLLHLGPRTTTWWDSRETMKNKAGGQSCPKPVEMEHSVSQRNKTLHCQHVTQAHKK